MRFSFYILFFLLIRSTDSFGQQINDSLLASFYTRTLNFYFQQPLGEGFNEKNRNFIIITVELKSDNLPDTIGAFKLKYFNDSTSIYSILHWPYKRHAGRSIYFIKHKIISTDTVDVNIGGWTIEAISRKGYGRGIWCRGGMGNIPEGRFIFSSESNQWLFQSGKELRELEIEREKEIFNRNRN